MWCSLRDGLLLERYEKEATSKSRPELLDLLRLLAGTATEPELFAVTSLGRLRITTAREWQDEDNHDAVWIRVEKRRLRLALVRAGACEAERDTETDDLAGAATWIYYALEVKPR